MSNRIYRSSGQPKREGLSWQELWQSDDKGLILCWEIGREVRQRDPELARCAEDGELPVLVWKGGVEKKTKIGEKYGSFNYLAQWQGLRGEDLDIDLSKEPEIICSKTGMKVIYTSDSNKYSNF
ncbi:MAG: hypothetical protein A4E71_01935 [Smithella sp. PtaU1.Bin162]|nr:MAG: hypothetical protein A4E71_01935 [Smithella sp. PtaU1.Bin162]